LLDVHRLLLVVGYAVESPYFGHFVAPKVLFSDIFRTGANLKKNFI